MLPRSLSIFYSDANLFSNTQGGVEREFERQEVPPSCSIESEQSVSLDDGKLQKFLEEQNNCKILPDLRMW